jgi:hypothetical protein
MAIDLGGAVGKQPARKNRCRRQAGPCTITG